MNEISRRHVTVSKHADDDRWHVEVTDWDPAHGYTHDDFIRDTCSEALEFASHYVRVMS